MRFRVLSAFLVALLASACSDTSPVQPGGDADFGPVQPSFDIVDAGNGGLPGFWFLPPLAKQVSTEGVFDPDLQPSMEVCELTGNPRFTDAVCVPDMAPVKTFLAGSAEVGDDSYAFPWNTSPTGEMDPEKFYRIQIFLNGNRLGYLDINPQYPSGQSPGEDYEGLYAFRVGENLPVKVFITGDAPCAHTDDYVVQCAASAVIDGDGGILSLEMDGYAKLSVVLPQGALPGENHPPVILTIERINPALFSELNDGEECIPSFDAPLFGDCLRVTTDPEIDGSLDIPAVVEMCINPDAQGLPSGQDQALQIIRYDGGVWQGLPMVDASTCDFTQNTVGLVPVPEEGLLRYAALGINTVARFFGPEPLGAHGEIRLGGASSEFSRFRWGLPGQMTIESGDGQVIQQLENGSESYDVEVKVKVTDAGSEAEGETPAVPSQPIEGATVHFSNEVDVVTGDDGLATITWTVPNTPGEHTLTATALGLLATEVPDHGTLLSFTEATVTFTATVVGAPASYAQSPPADPPLTGENGETLSTPLVITVYDENGEPVSGWDVTWGTTCGGFECEPGSVSGDGQTGSDGSATATWTLSTTPGSNTATATVGNVTATWNARGICPFTVTVDGQMTSGEWACAEAANNFRKFFANISGGETEAWVYWQNNADSIYFAVKVLQSAKAKVNSLRFDFDNTPLDPDLAGPSADDDAIGYDADNDTFLDEYLGRSCVNKSQSGCGSPDDSVDGVGKMTNDGEYTVYELSHPLGGDENGEDFIRASGQSLGFYLTLRSGNGAQGNTQWPGFRSFHQIAIW